MGREEIQQRIGFKYYALSRSREMTQKEEIKIESEKMRK